MTNRSPSRRRQRRIRITVAIVMLVFAAAVATAALVIGTSTLLSIAVVVVLICGIAAARTVYSELLESRRSYAKERADIAVDYQRLAERQSRANRAFADSMADRIAERTSLINQLHGTINQAETRATTAEQRALEAEQRAVGEGLRADHATEALIELQRDIEADETELIEELGSGSLAAIDLLKWEEKVIALGAHSGRLPKHA